MSPETLYKLKRLYPDRGNKELALLFGYSVSHIQRTACKLKLKKSVYFMENHSSWYRLGHAPTNNSIKGVHTSPETEFKPGVIPANTHPAGHIVIWGNPKRCTKYYWIKLPDGKWKELHRHNWEKKHGPIPKDKILVFKDKDTLNVEEDNLELITRAENGLRNLDARLTSITLRETWRRERLRVKYGLSQQTKLRINKMSCY